tara:strand:- start:853 stop:1845 length:993 start_codon:yes stop_codon:yes gene_type:complete
MSPTAQESVCLKVYHLDELDEEDEEEEARLTTKKNKVSSKTYNLPEAASTEQTVRTALLQLKEEADLLNHLCLPSQVQYFHKMSKNKEMKMWAAVTMPLFVNDLHNLCSDMDLVETNFVKDLAMQIGRGLRGLHKRGFVHLDLKPENVLYKYNDQFKSNYQFSVCDFGSAFHIGVQKKVPDFGHTLTYAAPETIVQEASLISNKSDVFSFGCLLFFVLVNGVHDMFHNERNDVMIQLALIRQSNNHFDEILLKNHDYFTDLGFINEGADFRLKTKVWYSQPSVIKILHPDLINVLKDMTKTHTTQRINLETCLEKLEAVPQITRVRQGAT